MEYPPVGALWKVSFQNLDFLSASQYTYAHQIQSRKVSSDMSRPSRVHRESAFHESEITEVMQFAFRNLSDVEREVIQHYATAGGRRGWTMSCGEHDKANSLRVRLHRALKKMRSVIEAAISESGVKLSDDAVSDLTSPNRLVFFFGNETSPHMGVNRPSVQRFICVTIEVPEDEFDSAAREALFDHFPYHQIRFSRSSGPSINESSDSDADSVYDRRLTPR